MFCVVVAGLFAENGTDVVSGGLVDDGIAGIRCRIVVGLHHARPIPDAVAGMPGEWFAGFEHDPEEFHLLVDRKSVV